MTKRVVKRVSLTQVHCGNHLIHEKKRMSYLSHHDLEPNPRPIRGEGRRELLTATAADV